MNEPSELAEFSDDPHVELKTLASALRAHAEHLKESGAEGLSAALSEPEPRPRQSMPVDAARPARQPAAAAPSLGRPRVAPEAPRDEPRAAPARGQPLAAEPEALDPESRKRALTVLAERVSQCTGCGLHKQRTQTVFARGSGVSGLCFVGEGPGADEDAQGFPFVGKAGQLLDRMIGAMGFGRDEVYVCNIVKCRPPDNRKPEPDEMARCLPFLTEQLSLVEPQVIVALGATAVQGLTGTTGGITRLRGRWRLYQGKVPVMPTFHPAYLLRNPRAKRDVWDDLQEVLRHMGRPIPSRS